MLSLTILSNLIAFQMANPLTQELDSIACTSKERSKDHEDWQVVNTRNRKKFSLNRKIETVHAKTPNRFWTEERLEKTKPSLLDENELRQQRLQYHNDTVKNQRSKALYDHRQIFNNSASSTISGEFNKSKISTIANFKDKMVMTSINFLNNLISTNENPESLGLYEVQTDNYD